MYFLAVLWRTIVTSILKFLDFGYLSGSSGPVTHPVHSAHIRYWDGRQIATLHLPRTRNAFRVVSFVVSEEERVLEVNQLIANSNLGVPMTVGMVLDALGCLREGEVGTVGVQVIRGGVLKSYSSESPYAERLESH